jgi:Holliday junction DNA helicase RuvB
MNMFTEVKADDGLRRTLRVKLADRPFWQRAGLVGTPLVALAAAVTLWNSDPSPAAAPPLPSVTVAAPLQQNVSLWDDYDEVHRFDIQVEESFYLPMENNIVIRTAGSNRDAYDVPPWTLLGATTVPGRLTEPFTSRFGLHFVMQPYTFEEMCTIVSQAAEKTGYKVSRGAIEAVVLRSREIPRIANHLLDRCADYAIVAGSTHIDEDVAQRVFALMGVDDKGLSDNDRKYLSTLYEADRPLGVASLEPALHMDKLSIAKSIEPYLVEKGYILLTGRGRTLTDKGIEYVEGFTGVKHGLKLAGGEN